MAQYDLIILNGGIVDGTGADPVPADLAIRGGKIVAVGSLDRSQTVKRIVDATGLIIAPGFIDIHTHVERKLLRFPDIVNYVTQGVTTVIGGNCGGSPLPIGEYFSKVDSAGIAVNLGLLIGHNTVRRKVMGMENRSPTEDELAKMKSLVKQAMQEGAMGLSTGLKYVPGAYSSTDEVVALAKVAADHGGIYATHMREEGIGLLESVREALTIGAQADIAVEISHFKAVGKSMWGSSERILAMVDSARASGQDVTFDQYPYTATSTGLGVLFPAWALAGGRKEFVKKWQDPELRAKVKAGVIQNILYDRGGGDPASVVIVESDHDSTLDGKTLKQITARYFDEVTLDNVAETVLLLMEAGEQQCIYHCLNEDDVRRILQHPVGLVASDGHTVSPDETFPHPRNFGTFPRVLGFYVRELELVSLQEAVRKMSAAVAERLGLRDRGTITKGNWADLVIFDPETIRDEATWEDSKTLSTGIHHVLVNGQFVVQNGEPTGIRPGKILR